MSNNNIIKQISKGVFTTTDATATKVGIANNLPDMFIDNNEQAIIRVVCKVTAQNILFADIAYYFEVHALFECNQSGYFQFVQIGSPTTTTHSEPASSVCTCTIDDSNDAISLAIAGEAGETFDWNYEAELTAMIID